MSIEELRAENAAIRASMTGAARMLDTAYGASGERLELRIARLIRQFAAAQAEVERLRAALDAAQAERDRADRAGRIISVLVEDAGGEVFIANGRIETAYPITLNQDGEGRDDELTIRVLYP